MRVDKQVWMQLMLAGVLFYSTMVSALDIPSGLDFNGILGQVRDEIGSAITIRQELETRLFRENFTTDDLTAVREMTACLKTALEKIVYEHIRALALVIDDKDLDMLFVKNSDLLTNVIWTLNKLGENLKQYADSGSSFKLADSREYCMQFKAEFENAPRDMNDMIQRVVKFVK
ncbi:MAG: hypothetical protein PHQ23_06845 [Candidatus Wallbacteria bacterium]|nr:hypothetical protein [Candidatus Wallbacteria bacterium]